MPPWLHHSWLGLSNPVFRTVATRLSETDQIVSLLGSEASSDTTQNPPLHHGLQGPSCSGPSLSVLCLPQPQRQPYHQPPSQSFYAQLRLRAFALAVPSAKNIALVIMADSFPQVAAQMSWLQAALPDHPGKYRCLPCFISSGQFSLSEVIFFVHVYFLSPAWNINSVGRGPAHFVSSVAGMGFLTMRL